MRDGIHAHPDWYIGMDANSSLEEFQEKVHKAVPTKCPKPCPGETMPTLPTYKPTPPPTYPPPPPCQLKSTDPGTCKPPRIWAHSGASAPLRCICPPPRVPIKNESCNECLPPEGPQLMTFYMYRAQGATTYPMES